MLLQLFSSSFSFSIVMLVCMLHMLVCVLHMLVCVHMLVCMLHMLACVYTCLRVCGHVCIMKE